MNSHKKIYCFCLPFLFCLAGNLSAQNKTISIDVKNVNLEQFFNIVENKPVINFRTGTVFWMKNRILP